MNIPENVKFVWKIITKHRPNKQKKKMKKKFVLMKKLSNLFTTPACTRMAPSKVIWSSHNPGFKCWKHTRMQISYKPVV